MKNTFLNYFIRWYFTWSIVLWSRFSVTILKYSCSICFFLFGWKIRFLHRIIKISKKEASKWVKVLKNGPSKFCRGQPLKNLKGYGLLKQTFKFFKCYLPKILLGPFLNTLSQTYLDSLIISTKIYLSRHALEELSFVVFFKDFLFILKKKMIMGFHCIFLL